jgi:uncharacterized protein YccT (UPF0319 family)
MPSFPRAVALSLLLCLPLVQGCSSRGPLAAYEGPIRPVAEVALLEVPEQVQVMAIDGREPPPSFLSSKVELALLPGEHVLGLRYVELFRLGGDEHEVIRSRQAALRFTADAGGRYRLEVPAQRDLDAARTFAKAPTFTLTNLAGGAAVESTAIKSFAEASLVDTLSKAFEAQDGVTRPVTNLDLLKDVWSRASEDERGDFRAWINLQTK